VSQGRAAAHVCLPACSDGPLTANALSSWDVAYNALCHPDTASKSAPLRSLLTAEESLNVLSQPWQPFSGPSSQEKSKFEARTAPINVTPGQNQPYSIDEIKEDSLWLSKQANISEYEALRLVVQEWQSRPSVQLLSGLTEEEALSVQEAAGFSNLGASTFVHNSSILANPTMLGVQTDSQFDSSEQRRLRIIDIYHSTCVSILRVSQLIMTWGCASDLRNKTAYGRDYRVCEDWLEQLGQAIAVKQNAKGPNPSAATAFDTCVRAIKIKLEAFDAPYSWDVPESIQEAAYSKWLTGQTAELVHILHIALIHADVKATGFFPSATIEEWFSTVAEPGFFCDFPTKTAGQQPLIPLIQILVSLISIAVLKVDVVIDHLESGQYTTWEPSVYLLDGGLLERITYCFLAAAQMGASPATPPAFAWAIITWRLTAHARLLEEDRDRVLESAPTSSRSLPPPSMLEEAILPLSRLGDGESSPFQDLGTACSNCSVLNLTAQLLSIAMAGFGTLVDRISRDRFRLLYLQLIRAGLSGGTLEYSPDLIVLAHTIMIGDRSSRSWTASDGPRHADPIISFCLEDDSILRPLLIEEAQLRYPYEITPFLKFFSAITRGEKPSHDRTPTILHSLIHMRSLMQRLPQGFVDFRLEDEEDNSNHVALSVPLPQFVKSVTSGFQSSFPSQRKLISSTTRATHQECMVIDADTKGAIVDDRAQPFVALWRYPHSALEYLVHLLSTYALGSNKVEVATQQPASPENATEIIGLFADLIHSSLQASAAQGDSGFCSVELLLALEINAEQKQDTVSLVLAIFEEELLRLCQEPGNEGSLELLVNCTRFVQALMVIAPNRVWPWLARSRLLEGEGNGGSLASILIGTEMVLGRYDFLIGCIRLFRALVDDAVERSVSRKSSNKALTRFNASSVSESGTSEKIMSTTLLTFGRTLASIYEGSLAWKYNRVEDRLEINIDICEAFTTVLRLAYSVDDAPKLSQKLTKLVAPTAEYITELYLTKSENDLPTNPILASLLSGADLIKSSLLTSSVALWKHQTHSTLLFSEVLVRVAILVNKPWTHLEQQLFKATPLLARLYATSDVWKSPVVILLETLVRGAIRVVDEREDEMEVQRQAKKKGEHKEPPSLLGHLGSRTAKNFLHVLSRLDEPLRNVDIQKNVWNLLAAVVTSKQQWFALYLLTGNTPREMMRSKSNTSEESRNRALLSRALDALSNLKLDVANRPWPLFTAMLEFVTAAQNHWSWAMGDLRQRKDFIQQLLAFLDWMAKQPQDPKTEPGIYMRSFQNRFASLAAEILAMYLHSSRQIGDVTPLKQIVPSLSYLENNALELPSYNVSLHSNLKSNIEQKFPGVTLANLKRTTLYHASFGTSFFYDLDLADKLLGFDSKWFGPRAGQGFQGEVIRANMNLSLVESQVQLLQSWKLLALELSHSATQDERLVRILIRVVKKCMVANAHSSLPEALFGQLMMARSDLAFALMKRLVDAKIHAPEARQLLGPIWEAIRTSTVDFDNVFSTDAVVYYRSLLRILYLSLHFHLAENAAKGDSEEVSFRESFRGTVPKTTKDYTEPISNQLMEILSDTVAKGFRSLATQLHAEPDTVTPSDFALLTALHQRITAIPEMKRLQTQAALLFANSNTVRYATSLFSWSDRLAILNNGMADPVYGELSLLFILSLSHLPSLAESMAAEGVLTQLNTANLMNYYRRPGGMGPFDSPPRLHSIWTKGILPLCLTLLYTVGAPIAAEISSFLNQFPEQLQRSSNALNSRHASRITLSIAQETHSLAAISTILDNLRAAGPRVGIQGSDILSLEWDKENVKEDIDGWMARKGQLREKVAVGSDGDDERVVKQLEAAGVYLGLGAGASV
jgi:nuclear pore complex protein Nup188